MPFGAKQQMYYKTAVKAPIARVLCTRVRATAVFQKKGFKITLLVRTRVQVSLLKCNISILSRLLQYILKALQTSSGKLKMMFSRAQF